MRLVADANFLLAAVLGGRAKVIGQHPEIEELLTTARAFSEVQEYTVILARKKRLSLDTLLLAMAALPVAIVEEAVYASARPRAQKLIGQRDPDDVDVLALVLHLGLPLCRMITTSRKRGSSGTRRLNCSRSSVFRNRIDDKSEERRSLFRKGSERVV